MGAVSDESLREVCTWIENGIDFPTSLAAGSTRPHIRDGFSQDLDELRRCFDSLDGFLTDIGVQEMDALTARGLHLDRLHIVFLPRVGYLLVLSHATAIEAAQQVVDAEDVNDTNSRLSASSRASTVSEQSALAAIGLDFVFTTEEHVYFKNARCHEIDAALGDISGAIGTLWCLALLRLKLGCPCVLDGLLGLLMCKWRPRLAHERSCSHELLCVACFRCRLVFLIIRGCGAKGGLLHPNKGYPAPGCAVESIVACRGGGRPAFLE